MASSCTVHVCTNGACRRDGAHAALVELEELAQLTAGDCSIIEHGCFGLCGRGPNISIERDDGNEEIISGVRGTEQTLQVIRRATGVDIAASATLLARLTGMRRVSAWEQELMEVQTVVDVLDVAPPAQRASAGGQQRYSNALARVERVLGEAPADAHPRRLAEAIRRQVVAARDGRPASPEVEDIYADDPSTWPDDNR